VETIRAARTFTVPPLFSDAIGRVLTDGARDPAFAAECLQLPSESFLAECCMSSADPDAIHKARMTVIREIAIRYRTRFEGAFRHFSVPGPYSRTLRHGTTGATQHGPRLHRLDRRCRPRAPSPSSSCAAPRT
jgi:hypothetical protein